MAEGFEVWVAGFRGLGLRTVLPCTANKIKTIPRGIGGTRTL